MVYRAQSASNRQAVAEDLLSTVEGAPAVTGEPETDGSYLRTPGEGLVSKQTKPSTNATFPMTPSTTKVLADGLARALAL